jgi:calcineurin-like phosphoesterase family protein
MTTYFTADTHWGHRKIIELAQRPYPSIEAMDADLIQNWNAVIQPGDSIWVLGDFAWYGGEDVFHCLNGDKHLIIGNHDTKRTFKMPWASQHIYYELTVTEDDRKTKVVLFHWPIEEWQGFYRGALHFHGHTHGRAPKQPNRWDVGVDVWGFRPVSIADIKAA